MLHWLINFRVFITIEYLLDNKPKISAVLSEVNGKTPVNDWYMIIPIAHISTYWLYP